MSLYWIGEKGPPEEVNAKWVGSVDDIPDNSLVFVEPDRYSSLKSPLRGHVYIVSDREITGSIPETVMGVIPRDVRVIGALERLHEEIIDSYNMGDRLIESLEEKELAIQEKKSIMQRDARRFSAIIKNATDIIFVLGSSGRIMFCNDMLKRCLSDKEDRLIGRKFLSFVVEEDRDKMGDMITRAFEEKVPSKAVIRLNLLNGRVGVFSMMSTPLIERGHAYAQSIIGRDITEIRAMQKRLAMQAEDLQCMIQGLAHELRNPIMVIGAYIKRLEKMKSFNEVHSMEASVSRIENMIRRIEMYEEIANMDLSFSWENVMELVRDTIPQGHTNVTFGIMGDVSVRAYTDAQHIRLALKRILENSVEAHSEKIDINVGRTAGYALVEINDNGNGIEVNHDRIFTPFFSTDPLKIGLGLTEARMAMVKIGGGVSVKPKSGPGAIFMLKIPIDRRLSERVDHLTSSASEASL